MLLPQLVAIGGLRYTQNAYWQKFLSDTDGQYKLLFDMKNWFKSNRTVKNPAQAGDAALALYYENFSRVVQHGGKPYTYSRETTVHTTEDFDLKYRYHHGKSFVLEFWGVSKGIVNIPLPKEGSLFEAIWKMNFTEEDMKLFTHFIIKRVFVSISIGQDGEREDVGIYRIDPRDKNCIVNKNLYY